MAIFLVPKLEQCNRPDMGESSNVNGLSCSRSTRYFMLTEYDAIFVLLEWLYDEISSEKKHSSSVITYLFSKCCSVLSQHGWRPFNNQLIEATLRLSITETLERYVEQVDEQVIFRSKSHWKTVCALGLFGMRKWGGWKQQCAMLSARLDWIWNKNTSYVVQHVSTCAFFTTTPSVMNDSRGRNLQPRWKYVHACKRLDLVFGETRMSWGYKSDPFSLLRQCSMIHLKYCHQMVFGLNKRPREIIERYSMCRLVMRQAIFFIPHVLIALLWCAPLCARGNFRHCDWVKHTDNNRTDIKSHFKRLINHSRPVTASTSG